MFARYQRHLRIWETNYGRDAGWFVECRGTRIAELTDARWEDMFWDSYRIEITTEDPELRTLLQTEAFWGRAESEELVWRNREFGEVAEFAFAARTLPEPGRVMMRALYLSIAAPWPWDNLVLWLRNRRRRRTTHCT